MAHRDHFLMQLALNKGQRMERGRWMAIWVGLLAAAYLAVLPMANTIALRNILLVALLIFAIRRLPEIWRTAGVGLPLLAWCVYLFAFPLFAADHVAAWQSLTGQWMRSVLAMLAGAGVALYINKDRQLFVFGGASAVPLVVHLSYFAVAVWSVGSVPWGYWGRETHHADLGYAAGHAILLLSVALVTGSPRVRLWSIALIFLSILSVLLAMSRAGLLFGLLAGALVLGGAYVTSGRANRRGMVWGLLGLIVAVGLVLGVAIKTDARWQRLITQLPAAWVGDAIQIECYGDSASQADSRGNLESDGKALRATEPVHAGDASRIVILRAGFELALQHPWGLDGSRQAYQKRLLEVCPEPVYLMAHTHNGWLDTVLALGWIGAALYLWVLIHFLRQGMRSLRIHGSLDPWAMVLMATSVFWILRGFTDSVFRDHMLEMQGFLLAYAATVRKIRHQD